MVTGGGRGIGRAVVLAYARDGAAVAVVSRTPGEIEEVASEARHEGTRAIALPTDVTDEAAVARMAELVMAAFGRCDILVNGAGVPGPLARVADISLPEWEEGVRGNLLGTFLCCRAMVPHMRRQRGGTILNVASGLATRPIAGVSAYSAAKAAVIQFSRVLAEEERPQGIRVFAVEPGLIRTALVEGLLASTDPRAPLDYRAQWQQFEAAGLLITPELAARLFVFLTLDAAADLAGQSVRYMDPAIQARLAGVLSV